MILSEYDSTCDAGKDDYHVKVTKIDEELPSYSPRPFNNEELQKFDLWSIENYEQMIEISSAATWKEIYKAEQRWRRNVWYEQSVMAKMEPDLFHHFTGEPLSSDLTVKCNAWKARSERLSLEFEAVEFSGSRLREIAWQREKVQRIKKDWRLRILYWLGKFRD